MSFLLPGIYKPFYIDGLMVHTSRNTFFTLIDIHNGVGLYESENKLYNIGTIKCNFIINRKVGNTLSSVTHTSKLIVYREKPLFVSTYQDSINSVFSKTEETYEGPIKLMGIEISYTPPSINTYDIDDMVLNRRIYLKFSTEEFFSRIYQEFQDGYNYDAQFCLQQTQDNNEYFDIYQGEDSYRYNGKELIIDKDFLKNVKQNNGIKYYVVNESFYKYFIDPETFGTYNSKLYRTYNNGEIPNFKSGRTIGINNEDVTRVFYDLFPHKLMYSEKYFPNKLKYDTDKRCCLTAPFFRMLPQINSNDSHFPLCCKVNYIPSKNVDSISTPETLILNKPIISEENLSDVKFYLIGVKSPLTILPDNLYTEALSGGHLKPEQDYITVIENYGRLKILSSDGTSLYTEEGEVKRNENTNEFKK